MQRKDLNLRMLDLARFHIGVTEQGGNNRGPMVQEFQKAVDGKAQGEPWCMSFIQYLIKKTIEAHGGASAMPETEHCLTAWRKTFIINKFRYPQPGWIVIWQHGNTQSGHVEIVSDVLVDSILTIGGNTGPGQGIVREGDGVYYRIRSLTDRGKMNLLGFIKVF